MQRSTVDPAPCIAAEIKTGEATLPSGARWLTRSCSSVSDILDIVDITI
jgi:hypothetical protein